MFNTAVDVVEPLRRPGKSEVETELERVCRSEALVRSRRGKQLLRYLIRAWIEKRAVFELKEAVIGVEVFGKTGGYNSRQHSVVRVTMAELREKLELYYETEGREDPICISIPRGSYLPHVFFPTVISSLKLSDRAAMSVVNARTALDQRTLPSLQKALEYLDLALCEHPNHPRLLSLKAMVHAVRAGYGGLPSVEIGIAESLVMQAKQSGQEFWELCVAEAEIRMALQFDWQGAARLFDRALELSHGDSKYNLFHAAFLASQLRLEEFFEIKADAVAHFAHDSVYARCELSIAQIFLKKFDEAEETIRETLTLFPGDRYMPCIHLGLLYEAQNRFDEALQAIQQVSVGLPQSTIAVGLKTLMIGLAGNSREAERSYREILAIRSSGIAFIPASQLGTAAIGAADYDAAADWFAQAALIERDPIMNWIAILPFTRHIHKHLAFRHLVIDAMKLRFSD